MSLSLGACSQGPDGPLGPLVGDWNLETVVRVAPNGKEIEYAYPSVRHYSECTNTKSVEFHVSDSGHATMRVIDHYSCMGEAENDVINRLEFEAETIESGRRWYLYYLWDHAPSPPAGKDDDEPGPGMAPIPERELWYTCTVEHSTLTCEDLLVEAPMEQRLFFSHEDLP